MYERTPYAWRVNGKKALERAVAILVTDAESARDGESDIRYDSEDAEALAVAVNAIHEVLADSPLGFEWQLNNPAVRKLDALGDSLVTVRI